LVHALNNNTNK